MDRANSTLRDYIYCKIVLVDTKGSFTRITVARAGYFSPGILFKQQQQQKPLLNLIVSHVVINFFSSVSIINFEACVLVH